MNSYFHMMNMCSIFSLIVSQFWSPPFPEGKIWLFKTFFFKTQILTLCLMCFHKISCSQVRSCESHSHRTPTAAKYWWSELQRDLKPEGSKCLHGYLDQWPVVMHSRRLENCWKPLIGVMRSNPRCAFRECRFSPEHLGQMKLFTAAAATQRFDGSRD